MSVDRSYLPFKSACCYQDRGMQKWMGFFLSEHNSALSDNKNKVDFDCNLSSTERHLLLSQAYFNMLVVAISVRKEKIIQHYQGRVSEISRSAILLKNEQSYIRIKIPDILTIVQVEEVVLR